MPGVDVLQGFLEQAEGKVDERSQKVLVGSACDSRRFQYTYEVTVRNVQPITLQPVNQ
jgi:hypothetical protein